MHAFGFRIPWRALRRAGRTPGFADNAAARIQASADERRSRWLVEGFDVIPEEIGPRPPQPGDRGPALPAASNNGSLPFSEHGGPQGHRKRLREKLVYRGVDALADYELIEMLLFFVWREGDTKPLAKRLINRFGSLAAVLNASDRELLDFRGVGFFTLAVLRLVRGVAIRLAQAEAADLPLLDNHEKLRAYLVVAMAHEPQEHFRVLFLDAKNRLIRDEVLGRGTVDHVPVYPREVVKRAIELRATALILVHNHPSGDPEPSRADINMTEDLRMVGETMSLTVHDHIIVGREGMISLKSRGWL